jgi:hypothetical protein
MSVLIVKQIYALSNPQKRRTPPDTTLAGFRHSENERMYCGASVPHFFLKASAIARKQSTKEPHKNILQM